MIIVSFINPDFEEKQKNKIVVGRSRTTVNAIVRVSIYHRLYSDGTRDLARFVRGILFTRQVPLWDRSRGLYVRAKEVDALAPPAKKLQPI